MIELGAAGSGRPMGDPADFGQVVAFLCSQAAANVNGARIVVDGGESLSLSGPVRPSSDRQEQTGSLRL